MLKGIDALIGPELLHTLARMGHGDRIAIVDTNFPAYAAGLPVHRLDGVDAVRAVEAIVSLLPLDPFVAAPLAAMAAVGDEGALLPVHRDVLTVVRAGAEFEVDLELIPRDGFYARTREAAAVVTTGETRPYGCFLLTKGVLPFFRPEVTP